MKSYKVTHYHESIFRAASDEVFTIYNLRAETPREAAVLAHGYYNGYTIEQMQNSNEVFRTIRERLEDTVKASPVGENTEEKSVFLYDNIAGHVITVEAIR